jgi:poly-gamma-glutamate synthesis protein (capsule biosynthesis protein)
VHWGENWGYRVPRAQQRFAHRLIDEAGVDVVHGHSSHHPKAIEVYRGRLILYGCGDLLDDYEGIGGYEEFRGELRLMYFPVIDVATGTLVRLRMTPTRVRRFRVSHASTEEARWLGDRLEREGAPFGTRVRLEADGTLALDRG